MNDVTLDPISAVTAADPYPYYASLVAERPLYFDERLDLWVASSSTAVEAALRHPDLRVRPVAEPVPLAIEGTPLGDVFGGLVRWQEGSAHADVRRMVDATLAPLGSDAVTRVAEICAERAGVAFVAARHEIRTFAFAFPALTTATLLGLSEDHAREAASMTRDIVYAVLPGASERDRSAGNASALALRGRFEAIGVVGDAAICNAVGFLIQGFDATAGLIGNTLVALARDPHLAKTLELEPRGFDDLVPEVARYDAPVQNTRRYAAHDVAFHGTTIRRDQTVLVVVAAANRDPAANEEPSRLFPRRTTPRNFTFGIGEHACPGSRIAVAIAAAGVRRLARLGLDPAMWIAPAYEPRPNVRIPTA